MNRFLRLLPWTFILIRAVSGPLFIYACFPNVLPSYWSALILLLFHLGFWGDIFDGILARYLKMDSTRMRKMDSFADVLFWIGITVFCYHQFVPARQPLLFGLLSISPLIAFDYIHCFVKFKKSPSAHALFSKFWGILLYLYFSFLLMNSAGLVFGFIVFSIGLLARMDATLIYVILNNWTHDVPSFVHAIRINRGLPVKRFKLFHSEEK